MEQNLKWPGLIFNFPWKAAEDQLIELLSAEWWLVAGVLQRILVKVSPPHSAGQGAGGHRSGHRHDWSDIFLTK